MRAGSRLHVAGFVVSAILLVPAFSWAATLSRGPYLQVATADAVTVRWRTDTATNSRVRVGTDPANLNLVFDNAQSTTQHEVRATGLAAATRYYYSIGSTAETLSGGDSTTFFQTSPIAGTQQPTRIWVIGDSGTANSSATAVYNAYRNFTGSTHTNLWLMLGDNAYNSGTDAEYQSAVFNMYPQMLRQSAVWATLGNHDGMSADSASQSGPYYDIFTFPRQAEAGGIASGTEAYYSFDYGNIHFVVLDSYETSRAVGSPMLTWLESDLQSTNADWIIGVWHHPPYSKGSHNSDTETELVQMRQNVLPILESHGVDLVLTGHSHSYERSKFIDGHYGTSSTFSDATHVKVTGSGRTDGTGAYTKSGIGVAHAGAVYAVAGSSGKTEGGTLNHPAMFVSLNELGSMVLDVNALTLDAKFLNNNGTVRDYFTITKSGGGQQSSNVSGVVWQDADADGIREAGESMLQNVEVRLYTSAASLVGTQVTGANGAYQFTNTRPATTTCSSPRTLRSSRRRIRRHDAVDGDAAPADGKTATFAVTAGTNVANVDAGLHASGGTPQTIQLQDGLNTYAGTQDAHVASGRATTNYGTNATLTADGSDGTNGRLVALLKWSVSQIPAASTVTAASLTVQVSNSSTGTYNLYAVNTSWTEGGATWNGVNPPNNQGALVGTLSATSTGSKVVQLNSAGIALVQGWVNGSSVNNGIMIIDAGSTDGLQMRSSEYSTQGQRPKLTVTYQ
jgi:hypothetical protein